MSKPRNSRSTCCDCLKGCMSIRPTEATPRMRCKDAPFCTDCRSFWEEVPRGEGRRSTWKCLECNEVMPLFGDPGYETIDWKHKESCAAIFNPCECKVRNKRPGTNYCSPCSLPIKMELARANAETADVLRLITKKRNPGGREVKSWNPNPSQENAIRALEGD